MSVKTMSLPNTPLLKVFDDRPGSNVMSISHHVLI